MSHDQNTLKTLWEAQTKLFNDKKLEHQTKLEKLVLEFKNFVSKQEQYKQKFTSDLQNIKQELKTFNKSLNANIKKIVDHQPPKAANWYSKTPEDYGPFVGSGLEKTYIQTLYQTYKDNWLFQGIIAKYFEKAEQLHVKLASHYYESIDDEALIKQTIYPLEIKADTVSIDNFNLITEELNRISKFEAVRLEEKYKQIKEVFHIEKKTTDIFAKALLSPPIIFSAEEKEILDMMVGIRNSWVEHFYQSVGDQTLIKNAAYPRKIRAGIVSIDTLNKLAQEFDQISKHIEMPLEEKHKQIKEIVYLEEKITSIFKKALSASQKTVLSTDEKEILQIILQIHNSLVSHYYGSITPLPVDTESVSVEAFNALAQELNQISKLKTNSKEEKHQQINKIGALEKKTTIMFAKALSSLQTTIFSAEGREILQTIVDNTEGFPKNYPTYLGAAFNIKTGMLQRRLSNTIKLSHEEYVTFAPVNKLLQQEAQIIQTLYVNNNFDFENSLLIEVDCDTMREDTSFVNTTTTINIEDLVYCDTRLFGIEDNRERKDLSAKAHFVGEKLQITGASSQLGACLPDQNCFLDLIKISDQKGKSWNVVVKTNFVR